MKNRNIIFSALIIVSALIMLQGCSKTDNTVITVYKAAVIANPTPLNSSVVKLAGTSYTLKWEGTSSTWDVYLGTTSKPALAKAGVVGNSYTFTTAVGGQYYWKVVTKDANGVVSTSDTWSFFINTAPDVPVLSAPADGAVKFPVTGALTWTASDPEGDAMTYDVYLGTTSTPSVVASGLTDVTYSPALVATTKYYWKVVAIDAHGYTTSSVIRSFTTGVEAIMTYTGNYLADEPAEQYSYDVTFAKASSSSVKTVNYWNSGWTGVFTIDTQNLTYTMPMTTFATNWTGTESGIVDPATGTMTGTYTIWYKGVINEQGVHTYTKKK